MKKRPANIMARIDREEAIRHMAESMRNANVEYIASAGTRTLNMDIAWNHYVDACKRLWELRLQ